MKVAVLLGCPADFRPAAQYALSSILGLVGVPFEFVTSPPPQGDAQLFLFYGDSDACPGTADVFVLAQALQISDDGQISKDLHWRQNGSCIQVTSDIVAAAFYLLTRWERREAVWDIPWVNAYAQWLVGLLHHAAQRKGLPLLRVWPWPKGYQHAVVLSHDVDQVELDNPANGLYLLKHAVKRGEVRGLLRGLFYTVAGLWGRVRRRTSDPAWHFERWMALEADSGVRSSFYLVPMTTHSGRDPAYDILSPKLQAMLRKLHAGGWEIGVHGSFQSYRDAAQLKRERERLEQITGARVIGIRQHYLQLTGPDTFRAQEEAGCLYDATLGYREAVGFRAGIAAPFHPFDVGRKRPLVLLELPLTGMDGAYFWHLAYTPKQVVAHVKSLLKVNRQYHGLLTLLWHQRVGDGQRYPGWWKAYESILAAIGQDESVWVAPSAAIARWWLAREDLHVKAGLDARGVPVWTCDVSQDIAGLTLQMWHDHQRNVIVDGVDADIEGGVLGEKWVRLERLSAGQRFTVRLR